MTRRRLLVAVMLSIVSNALIVVAHGFDSILPFFTVYRYHVRREARKPYEYVGMEAGPSPIGMHYGTIGDPRTVPSEAELEAMEQLTWEIGPGPMPNFGADTHAWISYDIAGVPFRCCWGSSVAVGAAMPVGYGNVVGSVQLPGFEQPMRFEIPVRPRWFGLFGDLAVHSIAWLIPLVGLAAIRGKLRRRRGRCPG